MSQAEQGPTPAEMPQRHPQLALSGGLKRLLRNHAFLSAASVASLLLIWQLGAMALPRTVFAPPLDVMQALIGELLRGPIWTDIAITLRRIALAFAVTMAVALVLGFAMALSRTARVFFRVWVVLGLTLPALVIMLTTYMVMGLNETAAIVGAALPVIAVVTVNIREGVSSIDRRLIDMARAYRAGYRQQLVDVVLPQLAPILMASSRFGLSLVWKMVLFVELLGRNNGIGYQIEFYYQMFNMRMVLAHALSFLLIMMFIEIVLLGAIERRVFRWRDR